MNEDIKQLGEIFNITQLWLSPRGWNGILALFWIPEENKNKKANDKF